MQRLLLARECGEVVHGLDDMLSARWVDLAADPRRQYKVEYCGLVKFVEIDRPNGSLILCGGEHRDTANACVGLFRYAHAGERARSDHLVEYVHEKPPEIYFNCGRWFPYDPAIFVTGSAKNGGVIVWDTEQFAPVTAFDLGDYSTVAATEMSLAPGARTELIAVARTDVSHLALFDMATGAATHRLESHKFPITGVTWAPINPHQVVSVDRGGFACLFDIRRSGKTACLVQFNVSRRMPTFHAARPEQGYFNENSRHRGPKNMYLSERSYLLGLSCVWNRRIERRANRKRPRSRSAIDLHPQGPPANRARFSPDGSELVISDRQGVLRVWDVFTGRLLRTFNTAAMSRLHNEAWNSVFEISRDGLHILCNNKGRLMALDAEEGHVVQCAESPAYPDMTDLTLHPEQEEALSVETDTITCWSPRNKKQPQNGTSMS